MALPQRDPKGRFVKASKPAVPAQPVPSPAALVNQASLRRAIAAQQARISARLDAAKPATGSVLVSTLGIGERRKAAAAKGYRGPLTRADLARGVR